MITEWRDREAGDQEGTFMLLGDRVRELRKEHGWSQGELGTRIGTGNCSGPAGEPDVALEHAA